MRRRDSGAITRGGKINTEFLPILHTNIQIFKNDIFYRDKNIRLKTADRYYAHIGRIFSTILTDYLRVLSGIFDDRMRILTHATRLIKRRIGNSYKKGFFPRGFLPYILT